MRSPTPRAIIVAILIVALFLAACGPSTTPAPEEPAPTEAEQAPEVEIEEEQEPMEEPAEEEEFPTVVVAMRETGNSLDGRTGTWIMSEIVSTITDTIISIDENGDFQPGLAESWEFSDDGLRDALDPRLRQ